MKAIEPTYGVMVLTMDNSEECNSNVRIEFTDSYNEAQEILQDEYNRVKEFTEESKFQTDIDVINEEEFAVATDQFSPLYMARGKIVVANDGNIAVIDSDLVDIKVNNTTDSDDEEDDE